VNLNEVPGSLSRRSWPDVGEIMHSRFESTDPRTVHSKSETASSGDSLNNSRHMIRRPFIVAIILFTLGVYSYPALETWAKTGSTESPPILASDVGLYLLISRLTTLSPGAILNPYYGIEVPTNATAHLKFRLAFMLFGHLDTLLGRHLWLALFVWNLLWCGLLCWIVVWLFEQFLPDNSLLVIATGFAFLMWSNFGLLKPEFLAWIHLSSLKGFENVGLAYSRPFFPQLPIPLLLAYLGLQMYLLRAPRLRIWVGMGLLQLLAFAIFPYTTLMMAGITIVATIWLIVARIQSVPWRTLVAYGTICAAVDLLYLRHLGTLTNETQTQPSVFHIEFALLPHWIGGMWMILGFLTVATAFMRVLPAEVKWPLVGLGLTNLSLLLGDVFFSETSLMMSHHAGYFVHATVAVLLTFILSAVCVRLRAMTRYTGFALGVVVILLAVNAMLLAEATYRAFLPLNQQQAETASLLKSIPLRADDLLIVRANIVDDPCEWAPLVSGAKVLFCRNAAALLTPNQNQTIQRFRQALYLYFTGKDSRQLERITEDPKASEEQMRLAYFGGIIPFRKEERERGLRAIRMELIPLLDSAERQDPPEHAFLRQYSRILVVDNRQYPVFDRQRLASYLVIQKEVPWGDLTILFCNPK
jgi:hypothetical protein